MYTEDHIRDAILGAGAVAYLTKGTPAQYLIDAIRSAGKATTAAAAVTTSLR
jgi:hypothetical protein